MDTLLPKCCCANRRTVVPFRLPFLHSTVLIGRWKCQWILLWASFSVKNWLKSVFLLYYHQQCDYLKSSALVRKQQCFHLMLDKWFKNKNNIKNWQLFCIIWLYLTCLRDTSCMWVYVQLKNCWLHSNQYPHFFVCLIFCANICLCFQMKKPHIVSVIFIFLCRLESFIKLYFLNYVFILFSSIAMATKNKSTTPCCVI